MLYITPMMTVHNTHDHTLNASQAPTFFSLLSIFNQPSCDSCQGTNRVTIRWLLWPASAPTNIKPHNFCDGERHSSGSFHNGGKHRPVFRDTCHWGINYGRETQSLSDSQSKISHTTTQPLNFLQNWVWSNLRHASSLTQPAYHRFILTQWLGKMCHRMQLEWIYTKTADCPHHWVSRCGAPPEYRYDTSRVLSKAWIKALTSQ